MLRIAALLLESSFGHYREVTPSIGSHAPCDWLVVLSRLELLTPTLSVWCSNQLSYRTIYK